MKEYPVTFAIQEAPVDAFLPDGLVEYRGVVRCKSQDVAYIVTKRCQTADQALCELSAIILRGAALLEEVGNRLDGQKHWMSGIASQVADISSSVDYKITKAVHEHTDNFKHKR